MAAAHPSPLLAHPCSFRPDRHDPYLRLGSIAVFVRDKERSRRFYLDQLGFRLALDVPSPSVENSLAVTPPDGTAVLSLIAPKAGSDEYQLIGRLTQIIFLTENVFAKFEEWNSRGVRFHHPPQVQSWGAVSTTFDDPDGNSFTLLGYDAINVEVETQRRAHAERSESEHRLSQELELARHVQSRLFPQTHPDLSTLEYAAVCIQARHVGGDYYDFLDLGPGRLGVLLADVSGKGVAAALLTANLQASFRSQLELGMKHPKALLTSVNKLFHESTPAEYFATMFFAEYRDQTRELRYINCGHPAALLMRASGAIEHLEATALPIGIFSSWSCEEKTVMLAPGDVLIAFSDGVLEAGVERGEEFGEARLIQALRAARMGDLEPLLDSIIGEVLRFSPEVQSDDVTLIALRAV
jgi:serine phosphatase RsbU (regulator of sigma subunit)/catechol 2,3-dioxygenase-like lactoylglutathione lyase family enzyme